MFKNKSNSFNDNIGLRNNVQYGFATEHLNMNCTGSRSLVGAVQEERNVCGT